MNPIWKNQNSNESDTQKKNSQPNPTPTYSKEISASPTRCRTLFRHIKLPFERSFLICRLYLFTLTLLINLPKTLPFPAILKTTEPSLWVQPSLEWTHSCYHGNRRMARRMLGIKSINTTPRQHSTDCVLFSWHFVRIREKKEESQLKKAFCGLFAWILDYDWAGIVPSHWLNSNLINLGIGWTWTQRLQDFAAFVLCSYCGKY